MKRILLYFFFFLAGIVFVYAQDNPFANNNFGDREYDEYPDDSITHIDASTIPVDLYMWRLDGRLGEVTSIPVDTVFHHFQNEVFTEGLNGEYNFLGNLGSPRESRIFFNRPLSEQFIFLDPYSAFFVKANDIKFTNTKSPFTNLSYHKGGNRRDGQERFKSYFSVNANKKLGFGFNFDYWYGRGMYDNQATSLFNGSFFTSYIDDKYSLHAIYSYNRIKMGENGGILNDMYITNPYDVDDAGKNFSSKSIATKYSNTWNRNKNMYFFLNHRYNLGFYKSDPDPEKEGVKEFVPVTSFIHTMNVESNDRRFIIYRKENDDAYYTNFYLDADSTNDITKNISVKNTFAISLQEGFSKWAKAGLAAFITHEFRNFTLPDTILENGLQYERMYRENVVTVGGEFAKRQGKTLHYNITGDIALLGEDLGQMNLYGNMDLNFRLFSDTVRLDATAFIKRVNPAFYFRHFHSNHYWWDNDLSKETRTRIEGKLTIDRWRTQLKAGVENVKNYTYFAKDDSPAEINDFVHYTDNVVVKQASENIQVFSAILKQDFKWGILHLDNEITYQKTSNSTILPLPDLNLYHNLYISVKLAKKVLSVELGGDVRYFTKYYAPDYSAAIGQFTQQNQDNLIELGGYPFVNVYLNAHLKRTRIYVMMSHVNEGSGNRRSFLVPHYPVNPRMFMFGLSWNFFD